MSPQPLQYEQLAVPAEFARATPPCPHFGPCGGCQLQDLAYSAQLEFKAARLRTLLAAANLSLPELQLHASPPLAYRNRIRLTLAVVDGKLRAGYLSKEAVIPTEAALEERGEVGGPPRFDRSAVNFVPITQCPIAAPLLWHAAEAFLSLANANAALWLSLNPDQLELFTDATESRLQLTLFLRAPTKSLPANLAASFTALCESLQAQLPQLAGAAIALLPPAARSRRTEVPKPGPAWGSPGLNYSIPLIDADSSSPSHALEPRTSNLEPDLNYWVPRGAFFQVNRFLLPELLTFVTAAANSSLAAQLEPTRPHNKSATPPQLAWDLYAGVGLFSRTLARGFGHVTAVEIAEPAFTALSQSKLPNLRAVKAATLDFLRTAVVERDRPALIVLDPPRTGLGSEVCALLARIAAPTLVYVSCSSHALAEDLATLAASGYSASQLHLFDLFPQTTHIETVAVLTRSP